MALFFTDYSLGLLGLRDGSWKFLYDLETERPKLFDLAADPDETHDLSARYPDRVRAYRRHLPRWAATQRRHILGR
jgi:hypothetical protein